MNKFLRWFGTIFIKPKRWFRTNFIKPKYAIWTPAYQSYFSAGDDAECFCGNCKKNIDGEDDEEICPHCGQKNIVYY